MASDIFKHRQQCLSCNGRKAPSQYIKALLVPIAFREPFEIIAVDILGPLPLTTFGYKYIIVFFEYLTKLQEAYPLPDTKSETVARIFVEKIVCRHGAPKKLLSDQIANFMSN